MLFRSEDIVALQVVHEGTDDHMLKDLARDAGQGNGPLVSRVIMFTLLEDWRDVGVPPVSWNTARVKR